VVTETTPLHSARFSEHELRAETQKSPTITPPGPHDALLPTSAKLMAPTDRATSACMHSSTNPRPVFKKSMHGLTAVGRQTEAFFQKSTAMRIFLFHFVR
jgi:hypothetical protein